MREAGARLMARDRLGRDVFARGSPQGLRVIRKAAWQAELYDLIAAYGLVRARTEPAVHVVSRRPVMSLEEALLRVERLLGTSVEWARCERFMPETEDEGVRQSVLASRFVESMVLGRLDRVEQ